MVVGIVLQQMHVNKAIKRYGEKAESAGKKEMRQIHERSGFSPLQFETLSEKDLEAAIEEILLIEEKRDGTLKGREVA